MDTRVFLILASLSVSAFGADLLVPSQYPTILAAINAATPGDTVVISPGMYAGQDNSNLHLSGKNVKIRSTDPTNPDVVAGTIIDCFDVFYGDNPAFYLDSNSTLILDGITILDGYAYNSGGGIYCRNSTAIIRNCVFEDCMAFDQGGAVYAENSFLKFLNCTIYDSSSDTFGGAIYSRNSEIELQDCAITESFARDSGGAIYAESNSKLTLNKCLLNDNSTSWDGGAICAHDCELSITDCNIIGNATLRGGCGGGIYSLGYLPYNSDSLPTSRVLITNSRIKYNFVQNSGGGILAENLSMSRCFIIGNISQFNGGGVWARGQVDINSSVFAGNWSSKGGAALEIQTQNFVVEQCTITDNRSDDSAGAWAYVKRGSTSMRNSIIWGNYPGTLNFCAQPASYYCDAQQPLLNGSNIITVDPLFVKPGEWENNSYIEGDYHLRPESACINAGDPNEMVGVDEIDLDGNARLRLGRIDMGAYESGSGEMDFDQDGQVNFKDFARFTQSWLWQAAWRENE